MSAFTQSLKCTFTEQLSLRTASDVDRVAIVARHQLRSAMKPVGRCDRRRADLKLIARLDQTTIETSEMCWKIGGPAAEKRRDFHSAADSDVQESSRRELFDLEGVARRYADSGARRNGPA